MKTETKSLTLELKEDAPEGSFAATFATLGVVDHDGDITMPGAFEDGKETLIGAYQHAMSNLPIGKGVIRSDDERAWIDGQFFMDTPQGDAAYRTVKGAGSTLEWSYIYNVTDSEEATVDGQSVRRLKGIDVWSVDPVLRGAGIGTGTDSIKSITKSFADHADELVTAVGEFVDRAESRIEMRAKDGRHLSSDDRVRLESLDTGIASLRKRLEDVLREPADGNPELEQMHLSFLELSSRLRATA